MRQRLKKLRIFFIEAWDADFNSHNTEGLKKPGVIFPQPDELKFSLEIVQEHCDCFGGIADQFSQDKTPQ